MLSIEKRLSEKNESGAALLDETKAAPSAPSSPQRMNHLDALRCLAMLNVVVAHAVTSFAVSCPSWWSSRDSIRSYVFDIIIFAIMGFTMQTFFMLSGYFTATHLKRHSLSSFALNRYKRIVLPFVFSTILIVPLFQIINLYGSFKTNVSVNLQPGFKAAIVDFFTTKFFPYFSFGHLWFLWYLVMLYAAVMIIKHLASRYINFIYIDKVLTSVLNSPVKPFLFAIPTALLMVFMTWMIDTPFGVIPEPHILAYYGFFFSIGMLLSRQALFFQEEIKHWRLYLFFAILAALPITLGLILIGSSLNGFRTSAFYYAALFFCALFTWLMIFGLLGLFKRRAFKPSRSLQYLTTASFWVYIIHLPVVLVFQLLLRDLHWPLLLKFLVVFLATGLVVIGSYELFVRRSFIGRFLNGKSFRKNAQSRIKAVSD